MYKPHPRFGKAQNLEKKYFEVSIELYCYKRLRTNNAIEVLAIFHIYQV